jgi:ATP-dependent helicase Lhr and Lhr-like helicase
LLKRAAPMERLSRVDFEDCLSFLAGELPSPPGAYEPEPGSAPRFTSPRIWRYRGRFGIRNRRVIRWFRTNVGTITSEENVQVMVDGAPIGTIEGAYAERLQRGDRFLLDGRPLALLRLEGNRVYAKQTTGDSALPRWTSDRQGLSAELALDLSRFRTEAARRMTDGPMHCKTWMIQVYSLELKAVEVLVELFESQGVFSLIPDESTLLVEEFPHPDGTAYAFHVPLNRASCEALGRATAARLGRRFGRNIALSIADLGWMIVLPDRAVLSQEVLADLFDRDGFEQDVLLGVDRGELLARRFQHVAATALMVLRRPEGQRRRVGGLLWVSQRLYPLVKAACPEHPLLRETRREVLQERLDVQSALNWLETKPAIRFRSLDAASPFTTAWIDQSAAERLCFEAPAEALKRLHRRIMSKV